MATVKESDDTIIVINSDDGDFKAIVRAWLEAEFPGLVLSGFPELSVTWEWRNPGSPNIRDWVVTFKKPNP